MPAQGEEPSLPGQLTRDQIVAQLVMALYERRPRRVGVSGNGGVVEATPQGMCSSCGEGFPTWHGELLSGKCLECFLELFTAAAPNQGGDWLTPGLLLELRRELRRRAMVDDIPETDARPQGPPDLG